MSDRGPSPNEGPLSLPSNETGIGQPGIEIGGVAVPGIGSPTPVAAPG
jgi:hypothetical protein